MRAENSTKEPVHRFLMIGYVPLHSEPSATPTTPAAIRPATLAETARGVDRDLKAGALSNEHLTYIVIALATAVIVILLT